MFALLRVERLPEPMIRNMNKRELIYRIGFEILVTF